MDDHCNVFITDIYNYRIKKFSPDGRCVAVIGRKGNKRLQFRVPRGIAIHPHNNKVYIADSSNHHVQILNPDLTFLAALGAVAVIMESSIRPAMLHLIALGMCM